MASKKLKTYRGSLSVDSIVAGMNAAKANATRLVEDAQILLSAGRFPTSASLAALSIEESGKVSILRQLAISISPEEVASLWKDYRSHTSKNVQWILLDLVRGGARKLDEFRSIFDNNSDHPYILDQVKQLGLYTDCLGDCHWSIPANVIDESLAQDLVNIAILLAGKCEVTVKEIELWREYVGAASKGDHIAMKDALSSWYAAMQKCGLKPTGINQMERFINEGF